MKYRATYLMQSVATPKTRLLLAKAERAIPEDAYLVLRKIDDAYQIMVIEQSHDTTDPVVLASFISPEDVDAGEAFHAACIALENTKPKRKPRKRKGAAK